MESEVDSDKDEEIMMYEEKPTTISELGNDLFELEESKEDSEDVPRLDALQSAPSIGHTQILAPFVFRNLSPLSFDELLPSNQIRNKIKVGEPVVTMATNLIEEVYLAPVVTKEGDYRVVNLEGDLIENVYILPVEQEEVGAILHGEHEFEGHQDGVKGENEPHPHIWEYERGVDWSYMRLAEDVKLSACWEATHRSLT